MGGIEDPRKILFLFPRVVVGLNVRYCHKNNPEGMVFSSPERELRGIGRYNPCSPEGAAWCLHGEFPHLVGMTTRVRNRILSSRKAGLVLQFSSLPRTEVRG